MYVFGTLDNRNVINFIICVYQAANPDHTSNPNNPNNLNNPNTLITLIRAHVHTHTHNLINACCVFVCVGGLGVGRGNLCVSVVCATEGG